MKTTVAKQLDFHVQNYIAEGLADRRKRDHFHYRPLGGTHEEVMAAIAAQEIRSSRMFYASRDALRKRGY